MPQAWRPKDEFLMPSKFKLNIKTFAITFTGMSEVWLKHNTFTRITLIQPSLYDVDQIFLFSDDMSQ
jgi:hypothetical protein